MSEGTLRTPALARDAGPSGDRIRRAPENFLSREQITQVGQGRRDFLRASVLAASATAAASVSFCPLQGLFGIITPSGLHFERHHQGWYDVDPAKHRFMVNGARPGFVKMPKVYTLDDLMRMATWFAIS